MLAAYRDGGFWTLLSRACWFSCRSWSSASFPPRGFVSQGSISSPVTDLHKRKLASIRLHRIRSTPGAPHWRLTLGWETSLQAALPMRSGASSAPPGNS